MQLLLLRGSICLRLPPHQRHRQLLLLVYERVMAVARGLLLIRVVLIMERERIGMGFRLSFHYLILIPILIPLAEDMAK